MATADQKYNQKSNQLNSKLNEIANKINHLKKNSKAQKLQQKKYNSIKSKLDHLNIGNDAQKKKDRMQSYSINTQNNLKSDDDYNKLAYLRPNNPQSNHSYVYLFLSSESPSPSNNVSSEAIEHGINRTTNTQANATSISVNGTINNESDGLDPVKKIANKIGQWSTNGVEMVYDGVNFYRNCIITSFTPNFQLDSSGTTNSCTFSMNIQEALYFDSDEHKSEKSIKYTGNKGAKKGNAKGMKYVIAKRGDTYARIARTKNTKLSTVKSLNNGSISEGKKVYYK